MRWSMLRASVLSTAVVFAACEQQQPPMEPSMDFVASFSQATTGGQNMGAPLSAREEVPTNASRARGQTSFRLSPDETELQFSLLVANIENVWQAHIHIGAAGVNGPVVVFLYGIVPPGGGRHDGPLSEGVIRESDLIARPAINFGGTMAELVAHLRAGTAYVNVHTNAGPGGVSGPGHLPPGEIRGQIRAGGPR
jgi:hypothetical protein